MLLGCRVYSLAYQYFSPGGPHPLSWFRSLMNISTSIANRHFSITFDISKFLISLLLLLQYVNVPVFLVQQLHFLRPKTLESYSPTLFSPHLQKSSSLICKNISRFQPLVATSATYYSGQATIVVCVDHCDNLLTGLCFCPRSSKSLFSRDQPICLLLKP
jgi:hypothetical protein